MEKIKREKGWTTPILRKQDEIIDWINKHEEGSKTKTIAICGSRRFKEEIRDFAKRLKYGGVTVFEPILHESNDAITKAEMHYIIWHHLDYIRKASACFIYNKDGYIGINTTIEIGFAVALNKPVYVYSSDEDCGRAVLFSGIIKTPKELIESLRKD